MTDAEKTEYRILVKEAIKEWMNEKLTEFGWFSVKALGSVIVAGASYFYFSSNYIHK